MHKIWTNEGYAEKLYCYYCKSDARSGNIVNENGYGCEVCRSYAIGKKQNEDRAVFFKT